MLYVLFEIFSDDCTYATYVFRGVFETEELAIGAYIDKLKTPEDEDRWRIDEVKLNTFTG